MAVCAARHHSSGLCKGQLNNVPRHQKIQANGQVYFQNLSRRGWCVDVLPAGMVMVLRCPSHCSTIKCTTVDASSLHFLVTQAFVDRRMSARPSLGGLGINLTVLVSPMLVMNWMIDHILLLMSSLRLRWFVRSSPVFGRVAFCG